MSTPISPLGMALRKLIWAESGHAGMVTIADATVAVEREIVALISKVHEERTSIEVTAGFDGGKIGNQA